jgi:hypothetical protein
MLEKGSFADVTLIFPDSSDKEKDKDHKKAKRIQAHRAILAQKRFASFICLFLS